MLGFDQLFPREVSSQNGRSDANQDSQGYSSLWTSPPGPPGVEPRPARAGRGTTLPHVQHDSF